MADLTYYAYDGVGKRNQEMYRYSQAVRVGDRIELAGQGLYTQVPLLPYMGHTDNPGGWNPQTGAIPSEINAQIDQAFANVDLALKDAGGTGWNQVFRVNSYHIPLNNEALAAMVRNFKRWMPNHKPIWTCVGVARLGEDDMRVEVEVVALDSPGK